MKSRLGEDTPEGGADGAKRSWDFAPMQVPQRSAYYLPLLVTALLIAVVWVAHLQLLPGAGFRYYDEFHTLDRSTAFARMHDWLAVYSVNEVSFHKPPLQYWMTALLLETGMDLQIALRLPSMLFTLGSLLAAGLLVLALIPWSPWAIPATVLLLSSSTKFWDYGLSAMLDSGATFFATLALATTILALRRPSWWYATAVVIVLGSLQKAPIGLVLVALFLLVLSRTKGRHGFSLRQLRTDRRFQVSVWIAVLGTLAWPLFQMALYDLGALGELFGDQMISRFTPTGPVENPRNLADLYELIIDYEPVLRWLGIAALAWLPWRLKRMELLTLPAIFAIFVAGMLLAGGHVTARYSLIMVPLLTAALAAVLLSLPRAPWIGLAAAALVSAAALGPIKTAETLRIAADEDYQSQIDELSKVGAELQPDETLVVCTKRTPTGRVIPALASYYAANGRPFVRIDRLSKLEDLWKNGDLKGPMRGVCSQELLDEISGRLAGYAVLDAAGGFVAWKADGPN
ncbi:glycosyltransferase family 39 protein [Tropicimonas sp. IMCC34043]|uniref:ArnT family glycosyltransferase n=1 Tax=Tropicimonas sp. IMCC34043 TaxID=2248760 RepID=UPI001300BEB7|nr:glycosyltransferase family 39 protein [Tropicimonas sp. IMCC34043]